MTRTLVSTRKHAITSPCMHIPVAPACNAQCNYCNRKYDCTNESRPRGPVTRRIGGEADVKTKGPSVIGIAGTENRFANENTFKALGKEFPEMTLCLSTNGLNLPMQVERLKKLGVKFITVTLPLIRRSRRKRCTSSSSSGRQGPDGCCRRRANDQEPA